MRLPDCGDPYCSIVTADKAGMRPAAACSIQVIARPHAVGDSGVGTNRRQIPASSRQRPPAARRASGPGSLAAAAHAASSQRPGPTVRSVCHRPPPPGWAAASDMTMHSKVSTVTPSLLMLCAIRCRLSTHSPPPLPRLHHFVHDTRGTRRRPHAYCAIGRGVRCYTML